MSIDTYDECNKVAKELEPYIELDGSEVGEACEYLITLIRYTGYVSDEFMEDLLHELQKQLDNFKTYSKIVEYEKVIPERIETITDLEWN